MSWFARITGVHISTHGIRVSMPDPIGGLGDAFSFISSHQSGDPANMRPTGPLTGPQAPFSQPSLPALSQPPYTNGSGTSAPTVRPPTPTPVTNLPDSQMRLDTTPTGSGDGTSTPATPVDPWQAFIDSALSGYPSGGGGLTTGASNELDTTPYSTVPTSAPASSHWMLWLVVLAILGGGYYFYSTRG
jgi:hypothetical protein